MKSLFKTCILYSLVLPNANISLIKHLSVAIGKGANAFSQPCKRCKGSKSVGIHAWMTLFWFDSTFRLSSQPTAYCLLPMGLQLLLFHLYQQQTGPKSLTVSDTWRCNAKLWPCTKMDVCVRLDYVTDMISKKGTTSVCKQSMLIRDQNAMGALLWIQNQLNALVYVVCHSIGMIKTCSVVFPCEIHGIRF